MKIGDLVLDKILDQMGILIDFHWEDTEDETYAVIELSDNTTVLCSYEDMELVATPNL